MPYYFDHEKARRCAMSIDQLPARNAILLHLLARGRQSFVLDVDCCSEGLEQRRLLATFAVLTAADSGVGSLRQAILDANTSTGPDLISFNIPGSGVHDPAAKRAANDHRLRGD